MKHRSLAISLALALLCYSAAGAAPNLKPTASFTVGHTHVDKYGGGEPSLILIPGLTDSAAVWDGTVAAFSQTHTIYALTLAGFGGLKPVQSNAIDTAVSDISTLITQEHLVKPVVIGHSLGGFTAIRVAEEHGAQIRGAIAVDGLPVFPGMDKLTAAQRAAGASQFAGQFSHLDHDRFMAGEKLYAAYLTQPKNVVAVAALSEGADPAASGEYMTEMLSADLRPALKNVSVPLLELAPFDSTLDPYNPQGGFKTAMDKVAYYQSLFVNDPKANVQLVDNSRHFIMFDQPQAFYDAVNAFLKTLP
ncbi:MAG: alpha/beta hydrolase [Candidatus Eremiobacteraeota bacterium]|nr:alpha/beta hydrolase [Candidatus Eremiobacteraeota bacterium]